MARTTQQTSTGDGPAFDVPSVAVAVAGDRDGLAVADTPAVDVPPVDGPAPGDADGLWIVASALWRRKWWILLLTVLAAGGGVALSLSLPVWFRAETRVMLPASSGGGGMSALIESVAPGAGGLLGGSGGDYTRYLAILTSRSVLEETVREFDLVRAYETADLPDSLGRAVDELGKNVFFDVSLEYNYLGIQVLDKSPQRAAQIANRLVDVLNRENTRLSSDNARERRVFIERRLLQAEASMDSVQASIQALQERSGVIEPSRQGSALMSAIAEATSAVAATEIQYETLRSQYGDDGNPDVAAAGAALAAARRQLASLTSGGSVLMPVPMTRLPEIGREYAQLQQELLIQGKIMEFVRPMYEQTVFEEQQTTSAVQVLDRASVPVRKALPKRSLVVIGVAVSVFVLACLFFALSALLRASAPMLSRRLRQARV